MEGIVVRSTGSWFNVRANNGKVYNCRIRGNFRIRGIKTTNPLAVGDIVLFDLLEDEEVGLIREIKARKNYIIRKSTKLSKISHIIAANIDQAFLVATLASPRTSTGFLDRFLVTAEAYHIPAGIIFNKVDIYPEKQQKQLKKLLSVYTNAGYPCYQVSAVQGKNVEAVKKALKDKVSLFAGHSGVGKSTLLNSIEPGLDLKTGEISAMHQKGKHITTFAEMHELADGGFVVDTPGIKEFGLRDFEKEEVAERFPEMRTLMHDCKFHNCTHVHEPGCAVKEAVKEGRISDTRYNNYLAILNDDYFDKKEWELR
ncbi:MAG: ribosome small subunit-dependent GTPase A [Bacteroidota bacterium]|nr:ribosome small subunit-dependent GTPase A [Bacteroidota bacterium]